MVVNSLDYVVWLSNVNDVVELFDCMPNLNVPRYEHWIEKFCWQEEWCDQGKGSKWHIKRKIKVVYKIHQSSAEYRLSTDPK